MVDYQCYIIEYYVNYVEFQWLVQNSTQNYIIKSSIDYFLAVADPDGGGGGATGAPLNLDRLCFIFIFFIIQFCIRMLKNTAHIARESITTTLELPGPA